MLFELLLILLKIPGRLVVTLLARCMVSYSNIPNSSRSPRSLLETKKMALRRKRWTSAEQALNAAFRKLTTPGRMTHTHTLTHVSCVAEIRIALKR